MDHPELEKKLADLAFKKKQAARELRKIATEAIETAEKTNKTMMCFLKPAGSNGDCSCKGSHCHCEGAKKYTTTRFRKKEIKSPK